MAKKAEILTLEQQNFRNAMSKLAAAVNIITTQGEAGTCGITATAVCSITDTPPTVLVCVNRNSQMNAVFKQNKQVCINILSAEQQELACHFAGMRESSMEDRFNMDIWKEKHELYHAPALIGSLANLHGTITMIHEVGTHSLFFVTLETIDVNEGKGLVYFNRGFQVVKEKSLLSL
ncbi:4-hydroxyphenylacetate 3-monooxygenase, reductase component [Gallibacterium sp. ZY190522]